MYKLYNKQGVAVGYAAINSVKNVTYCLFSSVRTTRYSTLDNLKKKYKMEYIIR